ncbi:MAG TPA: SAM-dependent methyltransferase, partial [Thermomicrobiales bacterium]|nr:SAM-dependent methyltransferase [Thermomicrobiales bacterium]
MTTPDAAPESPGNPALVDLLAATIRREGPIPFARFMDTALYHEDLGYYRSPTRRPGRGGDFITAPELHPFFGFTLAHQIADAWERLGKPDHLVVREHGANIGGLAYDIIAALSEHAPRVREALDYRLVDVNPHRAAEALSAMAEVGLDTVVRAEDPAALAPEAGVVLANEVADALPVHRLTVRDGQLRERWVTLDAGRFAEQEADLSPEIDLLDLPAYFADAGVDLAAMPDGAILEVSPAAAGWIRALAASLTRGFAFIIDYGYDAPTLYRDHRLAGTLRGYSEHTVTDDPFIRVGEQDLTAHVDFTWLARAARDAGMTEIGLTTQSEFLTQLGMGDLLMSLQTQPDVTLEEYYRAQAAVYRLIDPAGLGRFRVLGLARDMGDHPHALGFTPI